MSLSEFDIIRRYFAEADLSFPRPGIRLGIGDDAAVLALEPGKQLAMSMDVLVEGVHFPRNADPTRVGHRALAVNLSDLAAMGAEPYCFTLGLVMPGADEDWLAGLSAGLLGPAKAFNCPLVGGDVTRGPSNAVSLSIQVHGIVDEKHLIRRDGAAVGDKVLVTGCLGDGVLGLAALNLEAATPAWLEVDRQNLGVDESNYLQQAYYHPQPRIQFARQCAGVVSGGIDISDGLMGDLGHILEASSVGARLDLPALPFSAAARSWVASEMLYRAALFGGDDYELCLTAPVSAVPELLIQAESLKLPLTVIGEITAGAGIDCVGSNGEPVQFTQSAYRHF